MEDRECRKKTSTGGERDDSYGVLTPEISEVILFINLRFVGQNLISEVLVYSA